MRRSLAAFPGVSWLGAQRLKLSAPAARISGWEPQRREHELEWHTKLRRTFHWGVGGSGASFCLERYRGTEPLLSTLPFDKKTTVEPGSCSSRRRPCATQYCTSLPVSSTGLGRGESGPNPQWRNSARTPPARVLRLDHVRLEAATHQRNTKASQRQLHHSRLRHLGRDKRLPCWRAETGAYTIVAGAIRGQASAR